MTGEMAPQGSGGARRAQLDQAPLTRGAERILTRFGADPTSVTQTGTAVERFFTKVQKRFAPLVGKDGYRALLEEAHRTTVREFPVLENCQVTRDDNPFFGGLGSRLPPESPEEVWAGLTALTDEFLRLANTMGRDGEVRPEGGLMVPAGTRPSGKHSEGRGGGVRPGQGTRNSRSQSLSRGQKKGKKKSQPRRASPGVEKGQSTRDPEEPPSDRRHHRKWRILIMDRDRSTCEAMSEVLCRARDFDVVDYALTAQEVERDVTAEEMDFVVASAHLPTEEIMEVCRWLRKEHTGERPHIVVTGLPDDPAVMLRFLEAGAAAFTLEEFSVQGLRLTLRLLARGESVFPLRLQHLLSLRLSELSELVRDRGLDPDMLSSLTEREAQVLLQLEEGLTNRQIAKRLYISEGTVKSHVHQILRKLKVRDRKEAVRLLRLQMAAPGTLTLGRNGFRRESE